MSLVNAQIRTIRRLVVHVPRPISPIINHLSWPNRVIQMMPMSLSSSTDHSLNNASLSSRLCLQYCFLASVGMSPVGEASSGIFDPCSMSQITQLLAGIGKRAVSIDGIDILELSILPRSLLRFAQ